MVELSYSFLVLFLQVFESVAVSRNQINVNIINVLASKCSLNFTFVSSLAKKAGAVCKIPDIIPKGRLLTVDGLTEGSKAKFICDDYHFTNITHGVCRADGTWEGLDKPCVLMRRPPVVLKTNDRLGPGQCVIMLAITPSRRTGTAIDLLTEDMRIMSFHANFHLDRLYIARNTFSPSWGTEETDTRFWPFKTNKEVNLTLCVDPEMYMFSVDGKQMFTYKHRLPETSGKILVIIGFIVRSISFTDDDKE